MTNPGDIPFDVDVAKGSPVGRIRAALEAVLPHGFRLSELEVKAGLVDPTPDFMAELRERAQGAMVRNQASLEVPGATKRSWQNLWFRSQSEIKVAEALDRAGVMFFPLCVARLNNRKQRVNREPDFLICHDGKWGILEVDGASWHPPTRTVADHDRDRLFQAHGVKFVQHYDSDRCYHYPDLVVKEFFGLRAKT